MNALAKILSLGTLLFTMPNANAKIDFPGLPTIFTEAGFIGRSLDLYVEMFPSDLKKDLSYLRDKRILFVPGGPSSVKGELVRDFGINPDQLVMCDLEYPSDGGDLEENQRTLEQKIFSPEKKFSIVHEAAAKVNWSLVAGIFAQFGIEDFEDRRQKYLAYNEILKRNNENFLNDYHEHNDWMVQGDITSLPQAVTQKKYDLIFSSNLLHLYNHILDEQFHLKAYEQLTSLLAPNGRLLVFPITNVLGGRHKMLDGLIESLEDKGFKVDQVQSDAPIPNVYYRMLLGLPYPKAYYLRVTAP